MNLGGVALGTSASGRTEGQSGCVADCSCRWLFVYHATALISSSAHYDTVSAMVVALEYVAGGVLKKGEKLFLQQKVDPSLIGGFVIDIGALQQGTYAHPVV
jgi:hypothetical protein